ncbi:AAA family ATPase [Neobacillus sp. SuZ13]|uniref:AAA family ATPase n=1 Tax=Neobacillus sp. SuZ13 TaxID=3047875 RepID=UPI0024C01AA8|nr:AAA family ATPase [Neobacillus sp. SuZ13]WHY65010.1 AAA family ATPase [Neobacillus sp. SuZ13]
MRLQKIYIKKYKQLSEFMINFKNIERSVGKDPFRFLIGRNGVGKTSLLEAIGLIFTRILQDEIPGFHFELVYSIEYDREQITIEVEPNVDNIRSIQQDFTGNSQDIDLESRLQVHVVDSKGIRTRLDLRKRPFSEWKEYHPRRIIGYASGPTNIFEDVLFHSPEESIKSDIYDARYRDQKDQDYDLQMFEIEHSLINLKRLYDDASYLYINGETSKFVLICLSAAIPSLYSEKEPQLDKRYISLRNKLLDMIGGVIPIGITFVVDEEKLKELIETEQVPPRFQLLIKWMSTQKELPENQQICHAWNISRDKNEIASHVLTKSTKKERIAFFPILGHENDEYRCYGLGPDINPFDLLTILLVAKREGFLVDAHLMFKNKRTDQLFHEISLSDGEYLWLGRLGLVLLSRSYDNGDVLFLFDEPDVHLNESWNEQFVELLHQMSKNDDGKTKHEFIIATHSTLLLTDADPDQLYLLERSKIGAIHVAPLTISTFAANRADISKRIFGVNSPIGQYSMRLLKEKFNSDKEEELLELLNKVGPGYYRFRIHTQMEKLHQSEENKEGGNKNITPDEKD